MMSINILSQGRECAISWKDGHSSRFHTCWLRYNCQCDLCTRKYINQLTVDRSQLPEKQTATDAKFKEEKFVMTISEDVPNNHVTQIPCDWLRQHCYCDKCLRDKLLVTSRMTHLNPGTESVKRFSYEDIQSEAGLFRWLDALIADGLNVVEKVPRQSGMVLQVARRAGPILYQAYGEQGFFEVRDDGGLENYSNSNKGLHLHMDQPHYESQPGVQFMHFIEFDSAVQGGESIVVDLFQCADLLRTEAPEDFRVLTRVPTIWKTIDLKKAVKSYFQIRKTIIEVDYDDQIVAINWNPGTEEAAQLRHDDVEPFYRAYRKFWNIMHRKELQFFFRVKPGEVVVINNRRMAHSRKGFQSNGGKRIMETTYVNVDEVRKTYLTVGHSLGKEARLTKVGNRSAI